VQNASNSIEQAQRKIHYGLFWFVSVTPEDNEAVSVLNNGDVDNAIKIWLK